MSVDNIYDSMTNDALEDIASGICPAATLAELMVLWAHFRHCPARVAVYGVPALPHTELTERELDLFMSFEGVFCQFLALPAVALTINSIHGGIYIRKTGDAKVPFVTADLPPCTVAWDPKLDGAAPNYVYGEYIMLI